MKIAKALTPGALLVASSFLSGTPSAHAETPTSQHQVETPVHTQSKMSLHMRAPAWVSWFSSDGASPQWLAGFHFLQPEDPGSVPAPPAPPAPAAAPEAPAAPEPPADVAMTDEELLAQALADADAGAQEGDGNEIITITGSAIQRTETTMPSPVSVLTKADLEASGHMTIGDILQDLPAQSNGINTNTNNGGDGSTRVNLRGLGSSRTLVLINGRRHVAGGTGADASVDLNAIPLAIIDRIEVLKDGASAVYGSDAIGGVVNIITRQDYDMVEANLYTATSQRGDGSVYDMSFVAGHKTKKGNIVISAGFSEQRPIFAGDREFSRIDREWDFELDEEYDSGSSATPEGTIIGPVCDQGVCWRDPATGDWVDFDFGGNSDEGKGHFYNYQPENYLVTPMKRYNLFTTGDYKLHDNVRGFFEASFMNRKSDQKLAPEPIFTISEGIAVSGESVYNPFGIDLFDVRRRMVEVGNRRFLQDITTVRLVTGIDGKLPDDVLEGWKWEAAFNFGDTTAISQKEGLLQRSHMLEAIGPSYRDSDGIAQCGSLGAPGSEGCVPLNLLGGAGSITPEMIDYLKYTGVAKGFTQQQIWSVKIGGPIAETPWDGYINVALGASHRQESGGFQPDPLTAIGDTTGNKGEPTGGSYNVSDAFAELSIIPITESAIAEWLEINGAVRGVKYNTFGSELTWKLGALWKITHGFAIRGTYGTAFRAPSIGDLFSGQSDDFPSVGDPCTAPTDPIVIANCAADGVAADHNDQRTQLKSRVGGNPELDPETATVLTTGIVFEPPEVEGLALTLDYFNISIDNAIQKRGANVILANCYAQADRADCDKIVRNAADSAAGPSLITSIVDTQSNIGGSDTDGIDFGVGYDHSIDSVGRFHYNFEGTWLHKYNSRFPNRTVEGVGVFDIGVFPRWKLNMGIQWAKDGFTAGANARYLHHFRECEEDDCNRADVEAAKLVARRKVDWYLAEDIYGSYGFDSPSGHSTIALGINNVSDRKPSLIYQGGDGDSDGSSYDFLGRYFYMRFSQSY